MRWCAVVLGGVWYGMVDSDEEYECEEEMELENDA